MLHIVDRGLNIINNCTIHVRSGQFSWSSGFCNVNDVLLGCNVGKCTVHKCFNCVTRADQRWEETMTFYLIAKWLNHDMKQTVREWCEGTRHTIIITYFTNCINAWIINIISCRSIFCISQDIYIKEVFILITIYLRMNMHVKRTHILTLITTFCMIKGRSCVQAL